jgi:geranylgeranyl pyrophosphate synthase
VSDALWPSSLAVHAAVAERLSAFLDETGGLVAEHARDALSARHGVLSAQPHSTRTVIVPGACIAAGGDWHLALWPTAASECLMAAADLFDDAADADPAQTHSAGVLLTAGAGLLSLAPAAAARVCEDGGSPETALALVQLIGTHFASAANGQAQNLQGATRDPLRAFQEAAAKSGPLGALMTLLGARAATDDQHVIELLGEFGRRLAVRHQLLNDMRDAAPDTGAAKADVRAGAHTVPLAFSGSSGAPTGLSDTDLRAWEEGERHRVASSGGLAAAFALAEAERLRILAILDTLASEGHPVDGLRVVVA